MITESRRLGYNQPHAAQKELTPTKFAVQRTSAHQPQAALRLDPQTGRSREYRLRLIYGENLALGAFRRQGWIIVIFAVVGSVRSALLRPQQVALFATTADVQVK